MAWRFQESTLSVWKYLVFVFFVVLSFSEAHAAYGRFFVTRDKSPPPPRSTYVKEFVMPGVSPKVSDAYLCTAMPLNASIEEWVVKFNPLATADRAHHMLLFGCSDVDAEQFRAGHWDCGHHGVCKGGRIMYAWAKNAPAMHLPENVGFRIGGQTGINYLTLQIHYAKPLPDGVFDHSGLQMDVTTKKQKYKAGIYLIAAGYADIPPHTKKTHADMNCNLQASGEPQDIMVFAYRVHAHALGTVISSYLYDPQTRKYTRIAKGNPKWPQAFYPMSQIQRVRTSDILHGRCTWDSTSRSSHTFIGGTAQDEMCNVYLMYYTDRDLGSEAAGCGMESYPEVTRNLPAESDVPLPPNPALEEHAHGKGPHQEEITYDNVKENAIELEKKAHSRKNPQYDDGYPNWPQANSFGDYYDRVEDIGQYEPVDSQAKPVIHPVEVITTKKSKTLQASSYKVVENWGQGEVKYGQVVAVSLDSHGDVVVFHRGERAWDGSTFIRNTLRDKVNMISQPTLLHLDRNSGKIKDKWGANFFFMPHGLTLDKDDNIWVTDVGLHQVFKFPAGYGQGQPLLTLGTRFQPGQDDHHFCKPTGVAVLTTGEFFVSDGYCNSRIIKYSADGKMLFKIGTQTNGGFGGYRISAPPPRSFNIPHALTLAEDQGEVCVADRENGRVQCFTVSQLKFARQFYFEEWGTRLFSVAYTAAFGGKLFAVNGPEVFNSKKVQVFEINYASQTLHGAFSPGNQGLSNPHDIVVSSDGLDVYVAEIGPNKLWKFELESDQKLGTKAPNISQPTKVVLKTGSHVEGTAKAAQSSLTLSSKWSSAGVSTVVLGLLAIPAVVLTTLTLIIRARRGGRMKVRTFSNGSLGTSVLGFSGKQENGLNLGSLLNKHHGFEQVATEDLDHDAPDSEESDIEEFSQMATKA